MATITCAKCGADLDAVPAVDPCPKCGGSRRSVFVALAPASGAGHAGDIGIVVAAVVEFNALPAEQQRSVLKKVEETVTREKTVTLDVLVGTAARSGTATPVYPPIPEQAPVLRRLVQSPSEENLRRLKLFLEVIKEGLQIVKEELTIAGLVIGGVVYATHRVTPHIQCEPANRIELPDPRPAPTPPPLPTLLAGLSHIRSSFLQETCWGVANQ